MAIEINVNNGSAAIAGGAKLAEGEVQTGSAKASPILAGASLKVTSAVMSDLEKLVAQLKNESSETRMSVAQRRISILQSVLSSMADRITAAQRDNIVKIEELSSDLADEQSNIASYNKDLAAAQAASAALDAQIKALENAVKNEIQNGEDHRKQVEELKRQKAEEDEKILNLKNSIASAEAKVAGLKDSIASLTEAVGAAALSEVEASVRSAANEADAPEPRETNAQREKAEKKAEANDPAAAIREALDKIDAQIMKTIEENLEIKA